VKNHHSDFHLLSYKYFGGMTRKKREINFFCSNPIHPCYKYNLNNHIATNSKTMPDPMARYGTSHD